MIFFMKFLINFIKMGVFKNNIYELKITLLIIYIIWLLLIFI